MQRWKKFLVILGSTVLILFLAAWILATVYEDQVKNMIITSINKRLKTPVKVENIEFSFIRKFPKATLEFTDITAEGLLYKETKKPLLQAHKLNLNFNLWDAFSDDVSISNIQVSKGSVFIYIDKSGVANYDIWHESEGSNSTLDLKEVSFDKMLVIFRDDITSNDYAFNISNAVAGGSFSSSQYDLHLNSEMIVEHLIADQVNYLNNKETNLDLVMAVNTGARLYQFKNARVTIDELVLNTEGTIQDKKEGSILDLTVRSENAGLKELLSLVPKQYIEDVDNFRFDGRADFTATIKGAAGKSGTPLVKAEFSTVGASIQPKNSDHRLSNIRLKGNYTNRKSKEQPVSYLSLSHVSVMLDKQPLQGSLLMENLRDPWINVNANGKLDLATLSSFYKPDTLSELSGEVALNMIFKGKANNTSSYQSSGNMELKNVAFALKGKTARFSNFNGMFSLNGNKFTITNLNGNASGSDFTMNGSINNLFSFFLQPDQVLTGSASLASRNLDLNEILEDKEQSTKRDTAYYLDINSHFNFLLHVNLGVVTFKKFQAWNLKGDIAVRNKSISSNDLSFKSMSGTWDLSGTINASQKDSVLISCNADVKKIDINELFSDMGNFGQDVITEKNLRGRLTADITFAGIWSKTLNCNTDKVVVQSRFTIEQGELIKFEPMMVLSKYLKGADLQDIKFATLTNSIEIRNRKILIPAMEIKSSALEMTASGTHTFDNVVDYKMQLLLSQLVGRKVKEMNTEFGTIQDDGLGRSKIFLTMKGPLADPKISFDSKGVEDKIVQDVKNEKQNLKTILNKEFGWFKKDSAVVQKEQPKKKKEELQIERED